MAQIVMFNALIIAVADAALRSKVQDILSGLSRSGTDAVSIQTGKTPRVIVFHGTVPVGTDKLVRSVLNPDGSSKFKVSTIRNLPVQEELWRTATAENPMRDAFKAGKTPAPTAEKTKGKGKKGKKTLPAAEQQTDTDEQALANLLEQDEQQTPAAETIPTTTGSDPLDIASVIG